MMRTDKWIRFGRGQVHSGEERGYLYQSQEQPQLWKWKHHEFVAATPLEAIELLLGNKVQQGAVSA